MTDDKKLTLSGRSTLGVKTTVEAGKVRQSFSHGRSKPVVVEVKRKRFLKKPGETGPETEPEIVETPAPVAVEPAPAPVREPRAASDGLGAADILSRQETTRAAMKQAEDERRQTMEEQRRRLDQEKASEQEREREARDARRHPGEAPVPAAAVVETPEIIPVLPPAEGEVERDRSKKKEPEVRRGGDGGDEDESRKRNDAGKAKREVAKAPVRRAEVDRRRAGKLTVTKALVGDEGRVRSLASLRRAREKEKRAHQLMQSQPKKAREIVLPEAITVQELANRMAEKAADVIKLLMKMDVMATINQTLDQDTAELVVTEFGHVVKRVADSDVEIGLVGDADDPADLEARPPVVTVMGHVDHGKTSLLDAIRKADVVSGEAGGITQHIGAYQVKLPGGEKVTFLDTPGHEAFTAMRARGASITDIVVLVVAADDGLMPQTIEAINHARAAQVPIIVAINKMDKPGAKPEKIRQHLLQYEVVVEEMGGETIDVEVSALKRTGLEKLLEALVLQAEILELRSNPNRPAEGVVIEAKLDKGRGPVATVLVGRGTLKVGDIFVAGAEWGKVRALIDDHGQQVKTAGPSQPVEVLGLGNAPSAGDDFSVVESESRAREISVYRQGEARKKRQTVAPTLENMFSKLRDKQVAEYPVVIKGDVQGSVEAIVTALDRASTEDIRVRVLHSAAGAITESDVALAKASEAAIIGFNVRAGRQAREAAEQAGVPIHYYSVIYTLIDEVKAAMAGQLGPEIIETVVGSAEIKDVFSAGKAGRAAGSLVTEGYIRKANHARILRNGVIVYTGKITSLRRFKDDVDEVRNGLECGITFDRFTDMKAGDMIESYSVEERERVL